ncbi:MAG: hypothetical protein LBK73_07900 [Treponema sp.]|nr:hypothetical protein [Treponema sp.]
MSGEAWNTVKPPLEKRRSPEEAAERLEKERPCCATPGKTVCRRNGGNAGNDPDRRPSGRGKRR